MGLNSAVALDVFGAIIACITVAMVHIPKQPIEALQQENFFTELRIGYNAIRQNKALFTLLWIGAINMFIYMPINALFPLMSMNYFEEVPCMLPWWKLFLQLVCCWADFYWAHGEVSKAHGKYHRLYLSCGSVIDCFRLATNQWFYDICDMLYVDGLFCPIL